MFVCSCVISISAIELEFCIKALERVELVVVKPNLYVKFILKY